MHASRTAADASDAIGLADWAVENARLTALDALDSQAYAEELEKWPASKQLAERACNTSGL
jgi:hypothetical protein